MVRNVMKHTIHKWGSNILSIHEVLRPPNSELFVVPTKKMNFFMKNSMLRIAQDGRCWVTAGPAVPERSGSSPKGRTPNPLPASWAAKKKKKKSF